MLCCPVCGQPLSVKDRVAVCENNHNFDIAKEGYINLLRTSKSGDKIGDDKLSARSRRDFLNKGYYAILKDYLVELFSQKSGTVLDICCGEGYYTAAIGQNPNIDMYGFDISKEMVRLAAKRGNGQFFVANMAKIPIADDSVDYAIHLFAPFNENEFARILKPGGSLFSVVPGSLHLWGLKNTLYDTPYRNDEKLPGTNKLVLVGTERIDGVIHLTSQEDIDAVFRMTPYYFHTSAHDKDRLLSRNELDTDISFVIAEYKKEGR